MQIHFNGQPLDIADGCTVEQLLQTQALAQCRVAVEVNQEIVPRSQHGVHVLNAGDCVEVVHALGGG